MNPINRSTMLEPTEAHQVVRGLRPFAEDSKHSRSDTSESASSFCQGNSNVGTDTDALSRPGDRTRAQHGPRR